MDTDLVTVELKERAPTPEVDEVVALLNEKLD